jgi:hypothetical protein
MIKFGAIQNWLLIIIKMLAYYYCSDKECKGRGYIRYSKNKKN